MRWCVELLCVTGLTVVPTVVCELPSLPLTYMSGGGSQHRLSYVP
jgi:hypothetical protein